MYDVIVVGTRCAGASLALLLARKGYRVLGVDRAAFPSDTMSTHFIKPAGVERLRRWGLLYPVLASGCPPVREARTTRAGVTLTGSPPALNGTSFCVAPRRFALDAILTGAAKDAGAELRERFKFTELICKEGRVVGIRGTRDGETVEERARLVVGADGLGSPVARAVSPEAYEEVPTLTCGYYSYWSGVPTTRLESYYPGGRYIICFPTNDNLTCVIVGWPHSEFDAVRADVEGSFMAALDLAPDLAERVRQGRREERFVGTGTAPNYVRKPYGRGWALVGDAGLHRDPITAEGISSAFVSVELLAEAIDAVFGGDRPFDEAMAEYEARRNEALLPMYRLTVQSARLEPAPPEMVALLNALKKSQSETDLFFGAILGTIPASEYFNPFNLGRIITQYS